MDDYESKISNRNTNFFKKKNKQWASWIRF